MGIWLLLGLSASSLLGTLVFILMFLPEEASQGIVQKIFYFHVPSAFCLYAFLVLGALFSVFYLFDRKRLYDQLARAGMLTATFFGCIVIGSGPIWAKPIWGVYWTWDPRLTTTFVVFVLLLAYIISRKLIEERNPHSNKSALIGAILAVIAVVDIPLIHFSVKIWRGLHPSVLSNKEALAPEFMKALEMMILSCFLLGGLLCFTLFKYYRVKERFEQTVINRLQ